MGILSSILTGLITNTSYDFIKSLLPPFQFSDHNIQKAIQQAYDRALKQWTINHHIRDREENYLHTRLQKTIQQLLDNSSTPNCGNDLLDLFRAELEKDDRTQSFLHYCISSDTHTLVYQIHKAVCPQTIPTPSFSNDFFIQHLAPTAYHIPRTVRLISYPQQASNEMFSAGNEYAPIDLIARHPRLVILGSAGMGKSTELKQLALQLTATCCPFHLPLNTFTGVRTLEQMLASEWLTAGQPKMLLLDGLDEVLSEDTERVKREIGLFAHAHPEISILVSCRSNFYTLPIEGNGGSLSDFTVSTLEPLTSAAVQAYIRKVHTSVDPESFLAQVYQHRLTALLENPFWAIAMIEFYQEHQSLGRSITELLEYLVERNFKRDAIHYDGSIPLVEQRSELFRHLETIACCMNITGTRTITDSEVAALLSDREAYRLMRCSGTLIRKETDHWQFKHGYFQEFLSARLLSRQIFDRILPLIQSANDTILPGWQNTLTLLLNILPKESTLFGRLIDWLTQHDPAGLIAIEPEKLDVDLRIEIFKNIFNYYKEKDIWLDREKIVPIHYARFGQQENCIRFLVDEACEVQNGRRCRLNALDILQHNDFSSCHFTSWIVDRLVQTLTDSDRADSYLIGEIVNSISAVGANTPTIDTIYEQLKSKKDDHIRSSLYTLFKKHQVYELYIDYYLSGLIEENHTIGFEFSIFDILGRCNTSYSLRRILEFWTQHISELEDHVLNEFQETAKHIIDHVADIYAEDTSVYNLMQQLLHKHCKSCFQNRSMYISIVLSFFDKTNTREQLISDTLEQIKKSDNYIILCILAFALTPTLFPLLIEAYHNQIIDSNQLDLICRSTKWEHPELFEPLKQAIENSTDIRIILPPPIDFDAIHQQQEQRAFDLLFDPIDFQKACIDFLGEQEILSYEEYNAQRQNFMRKHHQPEDELANRSVLQWISLMTQKQPVTKSQIQHWFAQPENIEWFAMGHICQALSTQNPPKVSTFQKNYLRQWFDQNIETVDFTDAIAITNDYQFQWDLKVQYLIQLLHRFEFQTSDAILLDLTHCCFSESHWQERWPIILEYIEKHLADTSLLPKRIIENVKNKTIHINYIYESHVQYIFDHQLTEAYEPLALDLLRFSPDRSGWLINKIIELFFNAGISDLLTSRWAQMDLHLKLSVARQLGKAGNYPFIREHLRPLYTQCSNQADQQTVYSLLLAAGDVQGLQFCIQWTKQYLHSPFSQRECEPTSFETLDALPHLMTLLELSYDPNIQTKHELDRMLPLVMSGLQHLALAKRDNYETVETAILEFMTENPDLPEIRFLNFYIEQMRHDFGVKYAPTYTLAEAKQLLHQQQFT